jgi:hypothetical protein
MKPVCARTKEDNALKLVAVDFRDGNAKAGQNLIILRRVGNGGFGLFFSCHNVPSTKLLIISCSPARR